MHYICCFPDPNASKSLTFVFIICRCVNRTCFTGEVGSGKTTLVAKLQGVEEYMKGRGLEFLYFNVHDDDIDGNYSI